LVKVLYFGCSVLYNMPYTVFGAKNEANH
jgi:hypothetical protein